MGGRGGSSYREVQRQTTNKAVRERAENIRKIMADAGMPVKKSLEETIEIVKNSDIRNGYVKPKNTTGKVDKKKQTVSVGGRTFKSEADIDAYYDKEYKASSHMLGVVNASNSILGTSGGISIGNKSFTTDKELKDHYKSEAEKTKKLFKSLK